MPTSRTRIPRLAAFTAVLVLLAAMFVATACGGEDPSDNAALDGARPASIQTPTTTPEAAADGSVPGELVGTWVSTDPGAAELVYVFARDGTYKHAGVLLQQRDTGMFSFERSARGAVWVRGGTLVLEPASGTQEIADPDVPSANSKRPIDTTPERYEWTLDGAGRLQLTDSAGATIEYAHE